MAQDMEKSAGNTALTFKRVYTKITSGQITYCTVKYHDLWINNNKD